MSVNPVSYAGAYSNAQVLGGNYDTYKGGSNADWWQGLDNLVTGNLDWAREVNMLNAQQAFNANEAQKERAWSTQMRDTSYTSMINQYLANGLNPYLTLGGSGATAPTGASASSSSSHSSHSAFGNIMSELIGSASRLAVSEINKEASFNNALVSSNAKRYQADRHLMASREKNAQDMAKYMAERRYGSEFDKNMLDEDFIKWLINMFLKK